MISPTVRVVHPSDAATQSFGWGTLRWLCNGQIAPGCAQTFGISEILPGEKNPLHYHPNCEEILYVISGECDHSYDGQWVHLAPGSTIVIPANVRHNLINRGDVPVVCVIAFSAPHRETVFLES